MHQVLWQRAIIEDVPVAGNPEAARGIEIALRAKGVIVDGEELISYRERIPFRRAGAESYGAVFSVTVLAEGRTVRRTVYAKALIAGFGLEGSRSAVAAQVGRLSLLGRWGIRVPRVYGYGDGTIYLAWIAGASFRPGIKARVDELARIAAVLDFRGAGPLDFLADLRIDPSGLPHYIDVGGDLGHIADGQPPKAGCPAWRRLLEALVHPERERADREYLEHYGRLSAGTLGGAP